MRARRASLPCRPPIKATRIPAPARIIALGLDLAVTIALCIGGALLIGYSIPAGAVMTAHRRRRRRLGCPCRSSDSRLSPAPRTRRWIRWCSGASSWRPTSRPGPVVYRRTGPPSSPETRRPRHCHPSLPICSRAQHSPEFAAFVLRVSQSREIDRVPVLCRRHDTKQTYAH